MSVKCPCCDTPVSMWRLRDRTTCKSCRARLTSNVGHLSAAFFLVYAAGAALLIALVPQAHELRTPIRSAWVVCTLLGFFLTLKIYGRVEATNFSVSCPACLGQYPVAELLEANGEAARDPSLLIQPHCPRCGASVILGEPRWPSRWLGFVFVVGLVLILAGTALRMDSVAWAGILAAPVAYACLYPFARSKVVLHAPTKSS